MLQVSIDYTDDTHFVVKVNKVTLKDNYVFLVHPCGKEEVIPLMNIYSIYWEKVSK